MSTWTAEAWLAGMPEEILDVLTSPAAIARWAPIEFEVLEFDGDCLAAGANVRVRGGLAGRKLEFDVEIHEAHAECLSLVANGPLSIYAEYLLRPVGEGSDLQASVSVSGYGVIGGTLARAAEALLAAGALRASVARIERELSTHSLRGLS